MSRSVQLAFFFVVSLALHAAGLWAAAGHLEPRTAKPVAEVALVDRELFFRQAERGETRASAPLSADDRLSPALPEAARPSQSQASLDRAPAAAAPDAEPDRREPTTAPRAMARLEMPTVEPSPSPRRDPAAIEPMDADRSAPSDAEKRAPERVSGITAAPPPAAVPPAAQRSAAEALQAGTPERVPNAGPGREAQIAVAPPLQPSSDAAEAARAPAAAPEEPVQRPLETEAELSARAAEPLPRTAPEAPARGAADIIANAPADLPSQPEPPKAEAEAAPPLAAADVARLEPPGTRAPAGEAVSATPAPPLAPRPVEPVTEEAPAPLPTQPERLAARGSIVIGRAPAPSAPAPEVARNEAEDAPPVAAAEPERLDRSDTRATASRAAPSTIGPPPRAPSAPLADDAAPPPPNAPDRLAALEPRPPLRGTLPPPHIVPREARTATAGGLPPLAPAPAENPRLSRAQPDAPPRERETAAVVPSQPAPPAVRLDAPPPQPAPPLPPSPDQAPPREAPPPEVAALDPAPANERITATDEPAAGRNEAADWFVRSYPGGDCFFPVRVASSDDDALLGYGVEAESVRLFRDAFAQTLGSEADIEWRPLTDAQCTGISFARLVLGGSGPSLQIELERKELEPGVALAGQVSGTRFDFVTLLVVDDSGVVHNVLEYLQPGDEELVFSVPVHPVDDGADRVQLIMAVAASEPLAVLQSTAPLHSDDFFPDVLRQARQAGAALELGLEDFVILGSPR